MGRLLKDFRRSRGMKNRSEFARKVGVSTEGYRLIESGARIPRKKNLDKICEVLSLEDWERVQLTVQWLEERFRTEASEVLGEGSSVLISRFQERYEPLLREVMTDLPADRLEANTNHLMIVCEVLLKDILGVTEE